MSNFNRLTNEIYIYVLLTLFSFCYLIFIISHKNSYKTLSIDNTRIVTLTSLLNRNFLAHSRLLIILIRDNHFVHNMSFASSEINHFP